MCGISGLFDESLSDSSIESRLLLMSELLGHRGQMTQEYGLIVI